MGSCPIELGRGHHAKLDLHVLDPPQSHQRSPNPRGHLIAHGAPSDRQSHRSCDPATTVLDAADHPQVHDAHMQLGVLHRAEGLDELLFAQRHSIFSCGASVRAGRLRVGRAAIGKVSTTGIGRILL